MSDSLFRSANTGNEAPLAARMRPRRLDEFVGQDHILGPGRLLRRAVAADRISSLILAGPPGTGKTTIAEIIAGATKSRFVALNAVLSGIKELRAEIETAGEAKTLHGRRTILFVDEVHRWNKAQQDALLPWVENGTVILIGATTENPYFEVNSALVSRSRVFTLKKLGPAELSQIAEHALRDRTRGYGAYNVVVDDDALEHLIQVADGDARTLLGALELAVETTPEQFPPAADETIHITAEIAEDSIQRKAILYDREGDYHFDTISAFIKSLRGSDPDAALYWMARMIAAGEDPRFVLRRMLIAASEDIGIADPQALVVVSAAAAAFDRVGMPEGQFHLAQAALYLATAPKSNSTMGYFDARAAVEQELEAEVPQHLRDPNRDGKHLGHGQGYQYPHAYRDHWVAQAYLPTRLTGRVFYEPAESGYEAQIRGEIYRRRELQLSIALDEEPEILTTAPRDRRRDEWLKRAEGRRTTLQSQIRDRVMSTFAAPRHARVLVLGRGIELFLYEAARRCPEGLVVALCTDQHQASAVKSLRAKHLGKDSDDILQIAVGTPGSTETQAALLQLSEGAGYEWILARDLGRASVNPTTAFTWTAELLSTCGRVVGSERTNDEVPRLSQLLRVSLERRRASGLSPAETSLVAAAANAEAPLYQGRYHPAAGWTAEDMRHLISTSGLTTRSMDSIRHDEERDIKAEDLELWLPENPMAEGTRSIYAQTLLNGTNNLSEDAYHRLRELMLEVLAGTRHPWPLCYEIFDLELSDSGS